MTENPTGVPPGEWHLVPLGTVCDVQAGAFRPGKPRPITAEEGVPVVMPANIRDRRIVTRDMAVVSPADAVHRGRHRLATGDVLCVRTGDLGRSALVTAEQAGWLFGGGCLRLRPKEQLDPGYLVHYLSHPAVTAQIKGASTGSVISSLSTGRLRDLPIALPPMEAQREIARLLMGLDDKMAVHRQIIETSVRLREALVELLIAGEPT